MPAGKLKLVAKGDENIQVKQPKTRMSNEYYAQKMREYRANKKNQYLIIEINNKIYAINPNSEKVNKMNKDIISKINDIIIID